MLHKWGVIPHPNGNRNSQLIVPFFNPSIPPPDHYSTNLNQHRFKPQFPANSFTSPSHRVTRSMDIFTSYTRHVYNGFGLAEPQLGFNPDGPPPGIMKSADNRQFGPAPSEPSEEANFGSSTELCAGPPVRPPIPPVGLIQPSKIAVVQQTSSSGCPEQEELNSPPNDPESQQNASIVMTQRVEPEIHKISGAKGPIEILSINDQYEDCVQILATARTDLATLKTELEQIDKKLDDKMFLTKTLQIVTSEKTKKLHKKIREVSPSQTTAVELRDLYTEAQNALSQQINVEQNLAEMERLRAENLAARNLKNNEIQAKEDEVRDLEWQCKVMDTVFNRSSVLLKVSGALVQEPEDMKIPGLVYMVDELKMKLDSNPYILDEELTPPELAILEIVYKSKKMGRVIKKLKKWWRVEILKEIPNDKKKMKEKVSNQGKNLEEISLPPIGKTEKMMARGLNGGESKPSSFDVPKLRSESPECHEKANKLDRKRARTPIKSRGRGSVRAFDDESSFDRKQDARNKNRLYVPPIHSGFDNHPQLNKKPRKDEVRTLRNHFGSWRVPRRKRDEDHNKNRRSRSRSSTRQQTDDNGDDVIYIKTKIKKI
ncbi:hypothetical protein L5515_005871 [Caenorhabditis briggsae]|uniref:Uncharacterized protein n=1 Tax=Caenorhabditis briggsae TaxID=6238 RepID=A0AAE9F300_CAEBR|nr:hypothetical protein L5515_005871 [Caenorhabditis briggsae]